MTYQPAEPDSSTENVGRGAIFALLSIPVGVAAAAILGSVAGLVIGMVAIGIPYLARWLYLKGARVAVGHRGVVPFVVISAIAVILSAVSGFVAGTFYNFDAVNGKGGLLGATFATTLRNQLTSNLEEVVFSLLLGLGFGLFGVIGIVRGWSKVRASLATADEGDSGMKDATTPPVAPAQSRANVSSPGVILNGKPVDPAK